MFLKVEAIRLQGIEHAINFTVADDNTVFMRSYKIHLKKSGVKTPRIELTEIGKIFVVFFLQQFPFFNSLFGIGPSIDFTIRRTKIASEDLYKLSRRQPKQLKTTQKKNITRDTLGNKKGRVHLGKQKVSSIQTRKVRALQKTATEKKAKRKAKKEAAKE